MLFKEDTVARAQHEAIRTNAGWYRWTHDQVDVKGPDATKLLDYIFVNDIANLDVGRSKYTTMLNEDGKIIDDVIVMHRGKNHYWVSTLYGPEMVKWLDKYKEGLDVVYEDTTKTTHMYAVQGPNSAKVMDEIASDTVDGMKRFSLQESMVNDIDVVVHRSGFTGEIGYEIYCATKDSEVVKDAIVSAAKKFEAPKIDVLEVYVRSIPGEKGLALRQDLYGLTPFEAGLGWSVHMDKDFVGKTALEAGNEDGPQLKFVGIELERESYEDICQGEVIRLRGIPVGKVRACMYGYTIEKNFGFAIVDINKAPEGTRVKIGPNESPAVIVGSRWI